MLPENDIKTGRINGIEKRQARIIKIRAALHSFSPSDVIAPQDKNIKSTTPIVNVTMFNIVLKPLKSI